MPLWSRSSVAVCILEKRLSFGPVVLHSPAPCAGALVPCRALRVFARIGTASTPELGKGGRCRAVARAIAAPARGPLQPRPLRTRAPGTMQGRRSARGAEWRWRRSSIRSLEGATAKYAQSSPPLVLTAGHRLLRSQRRRAPGHPAASAVRSCASVARACMALGSATSAG